MKTIGHCRGLQVCVMWGMAILTLPRTALPQAPEGGVENATLPNPTSVFDEFGNAAPGDPDRRAVGLQGDPARFGSGINAYRRLAYPNALSVSNPFGAGRSPLTPTESALGLPQARDPATFVSSVPPGIRRAGDRNQRPLGLMELSLVRRQTMLRAMGQNAPVDRAIWESGGRVAPVPYAPGESPAVDPQSTIDNRQSAIPLTESLQKATEDAHRRMTQLGWTLFRQGEYRRASRAFGAAVLVDAEDTESRVGQLFCEVLLGATQTAYALLDRLVQHTENLFELEIPISERFVSTAALADLRTRSRVIAQLDTADRRLLVLHSLILWYIGEPEDAQRGAELLARQADPGVFGDWPVKMRAARASRDRTNR